MSETPSSNDLHELARRAERDGARVERVELDGRIFWIKRPGETQATGWHRLQGALSVLAPHPMLRVTVDRGGRQSVERERTRIEAFRQAGFLAPPIILHTEKALVLGDLGETLARLEARDRPAFLDRLPLLGDTLGRLHDAGLVHGRPSRRDLTEGDGRIGFLDFEENPQGSMPLAMAQARDVWLLFTDLSRGRPDDDRLRTCWDAYRPHLSGERRAALAPVVRFVARAATIVRPLTAPFAGRDLKAPMGAARFLHAALSNRR